MVSFKSTSIQRALFVVTVYSLCNLASAFARVQVSPIKNNNNGNNIINNKRSIPLASSVVYPQEFQGFGRSAEAIETPVQQKQRVPFVNKVKNGVAKWFGPKDETQVPLRQRLKQMGVATFTSFSCVQNGQIAFSFVVAWFLHAGRTGLSPMAAGQWKLFLALNTAINAGFKFFTPVALALSISAAPAFEAMFRWTQNRLRFNKAAAIGSVTLVTSLGVMVGIMVPGVVLAAAVTGVPIFPGVVA